MADDDKNKNQGDDKGGEGKKNQPLTAEQIEAIAKKAEAALAAEDDDKSGEKGGDKDGDKGGDDDDLDLDPKNIDTEKTLKYIDKLKDENAKRRIATRKAEKRLTKLEEQLKEATEALTAATTQIKESESMTAEQKAKEQSDLENAQAKIEKLTGKISELEETNVRNQAELQKTNRKVLTQDRENMITRLVQEKEVAFASSFEREGLIKQLTEMDEDGFALDNDEVILEVMRFIKDKKATEDKSTPGPGPGNRKTTTPIGDEIQALLKIKNMDADQRKRLDELLEMSGGA